MKRHVLIFGLVGGLLIATLQYTEYRFVVIEHSVEAGGRAEEAGFQKGDLICSIENDQITSLMELRRALNKPRPRIKRFHVMRGSQPINLQIPLKIPGTEGSEARTQTKTR